MSGVNKTRTVSDPMKALAAAVISQAIRDARDRGLAAETREGAHLWLTRPSPELSWWLGVLDRDEDQFVNVMRRRLRSGSEEEQAA